MGQEITFDIPVEALVGQEITFDIPVEALVGQEITFDIPDMGHIPIMGHWWDKK